MARILGQFFAYVCMATVLSEVIGVGFGWSRGMINSDKLFRIAAVVHDVDITTKSEQQAVSPVTDKEEMAYDEKGRMKAIVSKNLDLKQQALEKGIANLRFDRQKIQADWERYESVRDSFEARWSKLKGSTKEAGYTNVRLIWEKMKRGQAKDHIMAMVQDGQINDVIVLLSGMPNDKRAKIIKDFESPEESKVLTDILDLIRRGDPEHDLIDSTLDRIKAIKDERT